jgi:hypothetical protein
MDNVQNCDSYEYIKNIIFTETLQEWHGWSPETSTDVQLADSDVLVCQQIQSTINGNDKAALLLTHSSTIMSSTHRNKYNPSYQEALLDMSLSQKWQETIADRFQLQAPPASSTYTGLPVYHSFTLGSTTLYEFWPAEQLTSIYFCPVHTFCN